MKLLQLLNENKITLEDAIKKLTSIKGLINKGATESERESAQLAYDKILSKIKTEFGSEIAKRAEKISSETAYGAEKIMII